MQINLSGNFVTYFYILSLSVNFLFILLLIIRIPFYLKEKNIVKSFLSTLCSLTSNKIFIKSYKKEEPFKFI